MSHNASQAKLLVYQLRDYSKLQQILPQKWNYGAAVGKMDDYWTW